MRKPKARRFHETEALLSGWSVRQLGRQIQSQFFEQMALSKNKAEMPERRAQSAPGDVIRTEEAIKDPFVLEFLDLKDEYSELGDDFALLGRQRRHRVDDEWFRIDLIFFHRRLRCILIIDLKVGRFAYEDAVQMHMYLNYAREQWTKPSENPPVGLILCAEKGSAQAHYSLDNLPNKVLAAEQKMALPHEKLITEELEKSQRNLAVRKRVFWGVVL